MKTFLSILRIATYLGVLFWVNITQATTDFRVLSWSNDMSEIYYHGTEKQMVEIRAGKRSFSKAYKYQGESPLQFFRQSVSETTGEIIYELIAELSSIPQYKQIGLVFFKTPDARYNLLPMNIGDDVLPRGTYCFINLTARDLAFQVGENIFELAPKNYHRLLHDEKHSQSENSVSQQLPIANETTEIDGKSIIVKAAEQTSGSWKQILNVRWMLSQKTRTFVFIYNGKEGKISIRRFSERL